MVVDHTRLWQLKILIGEMVTRGDMTMEMLEALVKMKRPELERRLLTPVSVISTEEQRFPSETAVHGE